MKRYAFWVKCLTFVLCVLLLLGVAVSGLGVLFAGSAGMAVCLLLFFAVNPLFSAACGVYAGKNIKRLWFLPVLTAGLFLAGAWIFFDMGEPAFLLYCGCYLLIGIIAMLIRAFLIPKAR